MSTFWSLYVAVLTLGTLIAMLWLLVSTRKGQPDEPTDETVGHTFDGIEEYDNPLPRWWFYLFVATIVFALGYLLLYPGLGNWQGLLPGYEYRDQTAKHNSPTASKAGPVSMNGNGKSQTPKPATGRCLPGTPPCPSRKWRKTRRR